MAILFGSIHLSESPPPPINSQTVPGHPLLNSSASMGSFWLVTKLYSNPVVERSLMGEYLSFLLMKTYM